MCRVEVQEDLVGRMGLLGLFKLLQKGGKAVDRSEMLGIERERCAQIAQRQPIGPAGKKGLCAAMPAFGKGGGMVCQGGEMLYGALRLGGFKRVLAALEQQIGRGRARGGPLEFDGARECRRFARRCCAQALKQGGDCVVGGAVWRRGARLLGVVFGRVLRLRLGKARVTRREPEQKCRDGRFEIDSRISHSRVRITTGRADTRLCRNNVKE
mgnify:CR=1 FL=1